jgi:hypothetical protein
MEKIIEIIIQNLKNIRFWVLIFALLFIFLIMFPYLDANIFYYSRMEKRVDILSRIASIDVDSIRNNQALEEEYNLILSDIAEQREKVLSNLFPNIQTDFSDSYALYKFISGGALAWIIMIFIPFMDTFKRKRDKILAFFLVLVVGVILGGVSILSPIIHNPWINYVGFNIAIVAIIAIIAATTKKKSS